MKIKAKINEKIYKELIELIWKFKSLHKKVGQAFILGTRVQTKNCEDVNRSLRSPHTHTLQHVKDALFGSPSPPPPPPPFPCE
jgi:hypothetical protein